MSPHPRRWLRRAGLALATLVGLLALSAAAAYGVTEYQLHTTYVVPATALDLPSDSASIAHGAHVIAVRGCADCHQADFGGGVFFDDPLVGHLVAPNLTRAGVTAAFAPEDWERAIRHGVAPDGRGLVVMPAQEYASLSDEDLAAAVAYLRSLPPVERSLDATRVGPIGRVLGLTGQVVLLPVRAIDHTVRPPRSVAAEPTAAYGQYLATSCTGCHRPTFAGGPLPGAAAGTPAPANLTPDPVAGLGRWTEADFARLMKTGVRPDGSMVAPPMPLAATSRMSDVEVRALWAYLRTLPPVSTPVPRPGA